MSIDQDAVRDRLKQLSVMLYRGNITLMAQALQVSSSLVSRVINCQRNVGPKLVDALSKHPLVNVDWLLHGRGEPLLTATSGTRPVLETLVSGNPADYARLAKGDRHPVAAQFDRETRYWFRVPVLFPEDVLDCFSLAVGDLLLVETDPVYLTRAELLHRRVGVVRSSASSTDCRLASLTVEQGNLHAQVPGNRESPSTASSHSGFQLYRLKHGGRQRFSPKKTRTGETKRPPYLPSSSQRKIGGLSEVLTGKQRFSPRKVRTGEPNAQKSPPSSTLANLAESSASLISPEQLAGVVLHMERHQLLSF